MSERLSPEQFDSYVVLLRGLLRLSHAQAEDVASELRDHLALRFEELVQQGVDREDAIELALEEFGDAAGLATQFLSLRTESRRRWMMRTGIGSIAVCLVVLFLTANFWPGEQNQLAPAPAVAQQKPPKPTEKEPAANQPANKAVSPEQSRNQETEEKLNKLITAEFVEVPLSDAIKFVSELTGVQSYLDQRALDEVGLEGSSLVSLQLKEVPASFVLEMVLRSLEIGYHIRHGVVIITTPEELQNHQEVRVYKVRDLIDDSAENRTAKKAGDFGGGGGGLGGGGVGDGGLGTGGGGGLGTGGFEYTPGDDLIDLISRTVTPSDWTEVGGPASITIFRGAAVVSHTSAGHRDVGKLLEDLRAALE